MAESISNNSSYPGPELRLPRCCPRHDDWATLSEHLLVAFPDLDIAAVLTDVREAKAAVASVGLSDADALDVGELIARHRLAMRAGERADIARLDPERHTRQSMER